MPRLFTERKRLIEGVTARQKALVDEYVKNGGNYRKAWEKAYRADYAKPYMARQCAYVTMKRPNVRAYLERKLKRMVKRADLTEDRLLTQYQEAYDLARGQVKTADMIAATTAQAKLIGMLRDRVETGTVQDYASMESMQEVLTQLAADIGEDAARKIADALGIETPAATLAEPKHSKALEAPGSDAVN